MAQQSPEEQFFWACFRGTVEAAQSLLSANPEINVNWKDPLGFSGLGAACQEDKPKMVEYLVNVPGIDVNQSQGVIPLLLAVEKEHKTIVGLLLSSPKTSVNLPNKDGATPLYVACQNNAKELVVMIMADPRTDVNLASATGSTPLAIAVQNGHTAIVQYLVASGRYVDPRKKTVGGPAWWNNKTPAELVKLQALRPLMEKETEVEFTKRKTCGQANLQLLDLYEKDPVKARVQARGQLQIKGRHISPPSPSLLI